MYHRFRPVYPLLDIYDIKSRVKEVVANCHKNNKKSWVKYIDADTVIEHIIEHEHSYIVEESFLVLYDVGTPWFAKDELFLNDKLALRIRPGADFSAVPKFLVDRAKAAGAVIAGAGTSLSDNDKALAAKYEDEGFAIEAFVLTKAI